MASTLRVERDGRVLIVRIENPPRNFMDRQMVAELTAMVRSLAGPARSGRSSSPASRTTCSSPTTTSRRCSPTPSSR